MKQVRYFIVTLIALVVFLAPSISRGASFNASNLISDSNFIDIHAMTASQIQSFLVSRGSCLASFSENGRSAAQIIYDASHGYGDASGSLEGITINTSTGTVNPGVILTTLQKEQSLVSDPSRCTELILNKAMGYGCPDSGGCNPTYAGFTKQVEWGSWQLRYNYERAQGTGFSDYQVGQSFCWNDWNGTNCGRFDNRATASLYRYTPHVYNGNYNFWNLFHNTYQFQVPAYDYSIVSQNEYPTLNQGGAGYNFIITVKNTGSQTWQKNRVNLGTSRERDRIPAFLREGGDPSGWISPNRIAFQESSVAPGQNATYSFWMQNSGVGAGTYREYFQLVADGIGWMTDYGIYWDVRVPQPLPAYDYSIVSQNEYPTLNQGGAGYNFIITVKNTGSQTWQKNRVNLGTSRERDRIPAFLREGGDPSGWISPNRIAFQESSVAPGQNATYSFWMQNSGVGAGTYREYFQLVADGIGWMTDYGIYWDVRVPQPLPAYDYSIVSQNEYPTLNQGGAGYNFIITVKNTGSQTWQKNRVNLGTSRERDRIPAFLREGGDPSGWISPNRIAFQESSVAPGQNATYSFWMQNSGVGAGTYREYFQLVADGIGWMTDYGIYWDVRVN